MKYAKKAGQKLNALSKVTPYMDFSYCPLIWMFHSRSKTNKINWPHERCLRIVYIQKQLPEVFF